jgi:hypothetical protein
VVRIVDLEAMRVGAKRGAGDCQESGKYGKLTEHEAEWLG